MNLETPLEEDASWQVFDFAGRLLQAGTLAAEASSFNLDVANLAQGTYVLRLISGQQVHAKQFQK